jgi:hypothetical protein
MVIEIASEHIDAFFATEYHFDGMFRFHRSILFMKVFHVVISFLLVGCMAYVLYSGVTGQINAVSWIAFGLLTVEILILILSGWKCPMTSYTERLGAVEGSVTRIFLPEFLARNLFNILRILYLIGALLLIFHQIFG